MKLKSFKIKNYKSIIDSGECILSELDNVTIIAGQNESGKSSILQALRDFYNNKIEKDAIRIENEIPEITCTYTIEPTDYEKLINQIKKHVSLPISIENYLKSIKKFSIIKSFDDLSSPYTDLNSDLEKNIKELQEDEIKKMLSLLKEKGIVLNDALENIDFNDLDNINDEIKTTVREELIKSNPNLSKEDLYDILSDDFIWATSLAFNELKPKVIFFDDFCDLLPDKILISDLTSKSSKVNGYQAVKNIETILNADLTKLDSLGDAQRNKAQAGYRKTITANFNEKWKQKIDENKARIHIEYEQGRAANSAYLNFFIETKDDEYLPPRQRSQGFRWFLSFYLHLKAESERNKSLIILFDEPGLYLHSKAQNDMISVFEELAQKHQIIYSTHSPYLIDASKLHRIKLVINTEENGTTIEKITTNKISNQRDSLKPIIDAIGLEVAHNFSVAKKRNVILEGISDFYYLESFRKILNRKEDFAFIPAMGASNVHLLMELCIGWGLDWLIVFDEKGITRDYNKIKKSFFNNDENETCKKILKLNGFDGIEDLFDDADIEKLLPDIQYKHGQKKGDFVGENGGKELIARLFLEKVNHLQFIKESFSETTLKNFIRIFDFILEKFDFKN